MAPPEGFDTLAINALLIGAIQHLVLAADTAGAFAGVPLESAKDWERIRTSVRKLVRGVYPCYSLHSSVNLNNWFTLHLVR